MTQQALQSIRDETSAVMRRALATETGVALLDFPNHHNAGDSLIYAGQVRYLDEVGVRVDYISDLATHNSTLLRKWVGPRTILLQGGCNFGDRWSANQKFREDIVANHPDNNIVGLLQGIEYARPEALQKTAEIFSQHPDLTLMRREGYSYDIALKDFWNNTVIFRHSNILS